jgi:hypothetical protein
MLDDNYRITHKAGLCRTGKDNSGFITHAVIGNNSVCGNNPKGKSSWSEYNDKEITCKKCLKKLLEQENKNGILI